ncbi:hypothetical protein ABPG75_000841 [Micractinium tetrahymenae]
MPLWGSKKEQQRSDLLQFFPTPLPLPRVPAGSPAPQLVFASEQERARQQWACEIKVLEGCTKGLREGCSLQAARQCSPSGLLQLLGLAPQRSWAEREACQEACMAACLKQRQPECERHALGFCAEAFGGPVAGAPQQGQQLQPTLPPPSQQQQQQQSRR